MLIENTCDVDFRLGDKSMKINSNIIKINRVNPFVGVSVASNYIIINNKTNTTIYNFRYYNNGNFNNQFKIILPGETVMVDHEFNDSDNDYFIYEFYQNGVRNTMYVFNILLLGRLG